MTITRTTRAHFICKCGKLVLFGDPAYLYLDKFPSKEDDGFINLLCSDCHLKNNIPGTKTIIITEL